MRVIGLTGGIGSGKSTVGRLLSEAGAVVIDADQVARLIVEPGRPAMDEIAARFGPDVLADDGSMNRAAMAAIVFADPEMLQALEAITHPRISEEIRRQMDEVAAVELAGGPERLVVVEHPLLVETGQAHAYEVLVVVETSLAIRLARLADRGMEEDDAMARIAAQATDDQRRDAATDVLLNDGSLDDLSEQVAGLLGDLGMRT